MLFLLSLLTVQQAAPRRNWPGSRLAAVRRQPGSIPRGRAGRGADRSGPGAATGRIRPAPGRPTPARPEPGGPGQATAAAAHPAVGEVGGGDRGRADLPQGDRARALIALSAVLHVVGVNVHLPSIKFGWPWQAGTARAHRPRTPTWARGCCRRSRGSPGLRWAGRASTSCSRTRSPRTSARGRAGTRARSTRSATPPPRSTSTPDRPGGRLPRATTRCGCSTARRTASREA